MLWSVFLEKAAGVSYCDLLFCDQSAVNEFVAKSKPSKVTTNVNIVKIDCRTVCNEL